jgi:2,3-diketo-5-methylthio-1-phosphopentane phosphatase
VFCDFDGTFLVQDVGSSLARRYADERRVEQWARYERGEITAWQYNLEVFQGLHVPEPELEEFLRSVELDPGARALLDWCAERDVPFRILSDGYDYNVARLRDLHQLRFSFDANRLRYENGRWRISAVSPDAGCGCGTGNCKRGRIEAYRAQHPGITIVHVGNGRVSDLCGALAADVAFAKGSLADVLERRGEPYQRFDTLHDVVASLAAIASLADRTESQGAGRVGRGDG